MGISKFFPGQRYAVLCYLKHRCRFRCRFFRVLLHLVTFLCIKSIFQKLNFQHFMIYASIAETKGSSPIEITFIINGLRAFSLRKPFLFAYKLHTFGFIWGRLGPFLDFPASRFNPVSGLSFSPSPLSLSQVFQTDIESCASFSEFFLPMIAFTLPFPHKK